MVEIRILHKGEYKKLEVGRKELIRFTYQKYDFLDIQSYSTSFSQTIELEGNNNNISVLENITSLDIYKSLTNLENEVFINKKFECVYIINDYQFDGLLNISSIRKVDGSGEIVIECDIRSNEINITELLGDKLLRSSNAEIEGLDLSELEHELNVNNVLNTWGNYEDQGYYYPIINYSNIDSNVMKLTDFRPSIKAKYLVDKIFDGIGIEYESNFLNSSEFSDVIHCWTNLKLFNDEPTDSNLFNVGLLNNTTPLIVDRSNGSIARTLVFTDKVDTGFFDNSDLYNTSDGKFEVIRNGLYSFNLSGQFRPLIRFKEGSKKYQVAQRGTNKVTIDLIRERNGVLKVLETYYPYFVFPTIFDVIPNIPVPGTNHFDFYGDRVDFNYSSTEYTLYEGDKVYIRYRFFYDIDVRNYKTPTITRSMDNFSTGLFFISENNNGTKTKFSNEMGISTQFYINDIVKPINGIPDNIKQIDYIKSLFKLFNLVIKSDKLNTNRFLIEPLDYFIENGEIYDWTKKVDLDQTINISRMEEYLDKNILLEYKESNTYYNKDYLDLYKITYGSYRINSNEVRTTDDYKVSNIFMGTPCYYIPNTSVPIPQIYELGDDNEFKLNNFPMNILYRTRTFTASTEYKNTVSIPNFEMSFVDDEGNRLFFLTNQLGTVFGMVEYSIVNSAHHFSDPIFMDNSVDLNYGEQYIYYHNIDTLLPTENNIYNRFWKNTINLINNPNCNYVIMFLYLNAQDIFRFDLGDKIIIDQNQYLVNRILNWYDGETCEVELIKIID